MDRPGPEPANPMMGHSFSMMSRHRESNKKTLIFLHTSVCCKMSVTTHMIMAQEVRHYISIHDKHDTVTLRGSGTRRPLPSGHDDMLLMAPEDQVCPACRDQTELTP